MEPQAVHTAEEGRRAFTAAELIALALVLEVELPELLAPPLAARHEEVELPRGSVNGRALSDIVSPETPEAWERRANMDTVAHITPMLGGVISTLQILQASPPGDPSGSGGRSGHQRSVVSICRGEAQARPRSQLNAALADLIGQSQIGKGEGSGHQAPRGGATDRER